MINVSRCEGNRSEQNENQIENIGLDGMPPVRLLHALHSQNKFRTFIISLAVLKVSFVRYYGHCYFP